MSDIPKSERSESPLRAQRLVYNIRKRITAELMATFGYSQKRFEKHIKAVTAYVVDDGEREELAKRIREQEEDFNLWFIQQERAGAHLLPGHQRPHESGEHDLAGILARVRGKTSTVGQSDGVLQYAPGRAAIHSRGPSGR